MKRRSSGLATLPHFAKRMVMKPVFAAAERARNSAAWVEAEQHYARLCREFPLSAALHVQRGNMLKESGRRDEARQAYELAAWIEPTDADVWLQLGHLGKVDDRLPDAVAAYRRSRDLDPARPDAAEELSRLEGEDLAPAWSGTTARARRLPRAQFSSASGSMLALERLKVSLAHRPL